MSGKRRDKKGRILHPGEYQDESGRYSYKYKDMIGVRRTVYSWCLIPTDRAPQGRKKDKCLRDKIKDIEKELSRGVWHDNMNVYTHLGEEDAKAEMMKNTRNPSKIKGLEDL